MEELLDIRTIIFTLAFGNFVFGVVLILLQRREEQSLRNPFWIAAKFLQCTGWLLLAGRGTIRRHLQLYPGQLLSDQRICLRMLGHVPHLESAGSPGLPMGRPCLCTAGYPGGHTAVGNRAAGRFDPVVRAGPRSLGLGDLPWRFVPFLRCGPIWAASTLLLAVAASLRGIMALTTNGEFVLFSQNPIQFISFFILFYMMLANGFGMLVLSKEQTDLRLQEVLKEQKAILDTLPTGLCILRDRVIVACNPAMEAMFGFAPGTLQGQSVRSLYENDEIFETFGRSIYREIAATGRFEGEVLYQRRNGERFWAKDHGRTIILGERPEAYTVFSIIDITEQKNQQELLTRQKEELEATLARVKRLEGIISICMYCKKIRTEQESWEQLEKYITENSDALFSHGICPDCYARSLRDQI